VTQTTRNVRLETALHWRSADAVHTEHRYFARSNLWRDLFPADLGERLMRTEPGEWLSQPVAAGELVPEYDKSQVKRIKTSQFKQQPRPGMIVMPATGRFYPRNLLEGVADFFAQDRRPFRLLAQDDRQLTIDLNHPWARCAGNFQARVIEPLPGYAEHGGRCIDLGEELTSRGPGMQARMSEGVTDFFSNDPFARLDPRADPLFYAEPRLVQHIDSAAIAVVGGIYARFLQPGMRVLDLMSSWVSHLPESCADLTVTGLGMSAPELDQNPRLAARVVQDINADPTLPFEDAAFDAVVCSMSVEYLTRPFEVFAEVARVLKPDAPFVLTFSERWFPSKVIQLWVDIHPFERMAVVLDYFRASGLYAELGTESRRGLPRPEDDKYAATQAEADPVYAVWGRRVAS